jgi:hypothetical protein
MKTEGGQLILNGLKDVPDELRERFLAAPQGGNGFDVKHIRAARDAPAENLNKAADEKSDGVLFSQQPKFPEAEFAENEFVKHARITNREC